MGTTGPGAECGSGTPGYRTKREADRARIELLSRVDRGSYVPPSKLTLGAFLTQEWLPAKRATVKETTLASYEVHVTKHIVPRMGGVPLLEPRRSAPQRLLRRAPRRRSTATAAAGLSPTTVRRIHATLHKALADGVRWGRLPRNPADDADPPRAAAVEMTIWDPEQLRNFLYSVRTDRLFATWLLAATTGMRRGELLGMRWCDVDLDEATISIRQIRTVARYEVLTLTPKTEKGARTIALDPETVATLRAHRVAQMERRLLLGSSYEDSGDLVFTSEDGSPIHPERLSAPLQTALCALWPARDPTP